MGEAFFSPIDCLFSLLYVFHSFCVSLFSDNFLHNYIQLSLHKYCSKLLQLLIHYPLPSVSWPFLVNIWEWGYLFLCYLFHFIFLNNYFLYLCQYCFIPLLTLQCVGVSIEVYLFCVWSLFFVFFQYIFEVCLFCICFSTTENRPNPNVSGKDSTSSLLSTGSDSGEDSSSCSSDIDGDIELIDNDNLAKEESGLSMVSLKVKWPKVIYRKMIRRGGMKGMETVGGVIHGDWMNLKHSW